jgi:hypothetical protein
MSLNIPIKLPHPIAEALRQQYGDDYFLKAHELNEIVEAINALETEENDIEWEVDEWD